MFELRRSTMNASYSIPETAKLTGIPEHAIREYAKQFADVLPAPETNDSGRPAVKRYPDAALAMFRSIRKLKDEGLDTAEIRTALQGPNATDGYAQWDNIALQTAAEAALDAEAETTEWQQEGCEGEFQAAEVHASHDEAYEMTTEEWHAPATETTPGDTTSGMAEAVSTEEAVQGESESAAEEVPASCATGDEEGEYETWSEAGAATTEGTEAIATVTVEAETTETTTPATTEATESFHPLFTHLSDGLLQLRKIMDGNTSERESLRSEREMLLAETAAKSSEIEALKSTISSHEDKICGLQSALNLLMSQCDQQLQAIRSALGQA
jgi:DNA-binding transcriptional MerR regulator